MLEHERGEKEPTGIARRSEALTLASEYGSRDGVVETGRGLPRVRVVARAGGFHRECGGTADPGTQRLAERTLGRHRFECGPECLERRLAPDRAHDVEGDDVRSAFPDRAEVRVANEARVRPLLDVTAATAHFHRVAGNTSCVAARAKLEERREDPQPATGPVVAFDGPFPS